MFLIVLDFAITFYMLPGSGRVNPSVITLLSFVLALSSSGKGHHPAENVLMKESCKLHFMHLYSGFYLVPRLRNSGLVLAFLRPSVAPHSCPIHPSLQPAMVPLVPASSTGLAGCPARWPISLLSLQNWEHHHQD